MTEVISSNSSVAAKLDEVAQLLEDQGANSFRVSAYKRAAATIRDLDQSLEEIVQKEGLAGRRIVRGREEACRRHYIRPLPPVEPRKKIYDGFSI